MVPVLWMMTLRPRGSVTYRRPSRTGMGARCSRPGGLSPEPQDLASATESCCAFGRCDGQPYNLEIYTLFWYINFKANVCTVMIWGKQMKIHLFSAYPDNYTLFRVCFWSLEFHFDCVRFPTYQCKKRIP